MLLVMGIKVALLLMLLGGGYVLRTTEEVYMELHRPFTGCGTFR